MSTRKVKILQQMVGTEPRDVGDVVEVDAEFAQRLIDKGIGAPHDSGSRDATNRPKGRTTSKVPCPEGDCDYEGTERGLKIHTGQVHG